MARAIVRIAVLAALAVTISGCVQLVEEEAEAPAKPEAEPMAEVVEVTPATPMPMEAPVPEGIVVERLPVEITVDGTLTDWSYEGVQPLFTIGSNDQVTGPGSPLLKSPNDCVATFVLAYTDEALYLMAKVEDDELNAGYDDNMRTGDSVAFYFSSDPYDWREGVNRILIRPMTGERETDVNVKGWYETELQAAEVETKSGYWGYNVEVAIPMELLEKMAPSVKDKGVVLMQVGVFDSDGPMDSEERTSLTINGQPPDLWSADGYERFILK